MAVLLQRRRFVELLISTNKSLVNKWDKRRSGSDLLHNSRYHCCMDVMSSEALRIPSVPPTIPYHHVKKATPLHYALDMSEYQERHTVQNLIGAPKSYVGYGDGGALTQPLQANPRAVSLMTDVSRIQRMGRFPARCYFYHDLKQNLKRDEFIGRVNQIVVFLPLNKEEIEIAVQRELATWCERAEEKHKIRLTWTDEVVRKLAASYDVNYGMRPVANEVQRIALQLVADAHIRGKISENWQAELTLNEVGDMMQQVHQYRAQ
ncbi:hypothetical protein ACEPAF_1054 [Sanghuangporus sanghuang]